MWTVRRFSFAVPFLLLLAWAASEPPANSASLEITTAPRMPARIYLFKDGAPFRLTPVDAVLPLRSDLYYRDRIFAANPDPKTLEIVARDQYHYLLLKGAARFHLPPGKYRVEAYRGYFYTPAVIEFVLSASEERRVSLPLKPWEGVDPKQWISSDDHIHLTRAQTDDPVFLSWLEAEDLTVGNFLQLQRQMDAAVQYAHGKAGEARRGGYVIRTGQESRNEFWGHINLLGASELIRPMSTGAMYANSAESDPWPSLWFDRARRLGATVGYAHFFEPPQNSAIYMDAALGTMDFVEVFQFGVLKAAPWYELWNAGLRVTGVAGSDFPVPLNNRVPWPRWLPLLGPERTLVKAAPGENSFDAWARGIKEGRVVVSNGPLVELTLDRARGVAKASAAFFRPLETLEIVRNGAVIAEAKGDGARMRLEVDAPLDGCCWIAARVRARKQDPEPDIQAHTNPVWLVENVPPEQLKAGRDVIAAKWEAQLERFRRAGITFSTPGRRQEFFDSAERALAQLRR